VWSTWKNIGTHNNIWNHKILLLGGSAGGNLSVMAATLSQSGTSRPDAVAGLSTVPRFTQMVDQELYVVWGCDHPSTYPPYPQSDDEENCAVGQPTHPGYREGGINRYLSCSIDEPPEPEGGYYDSTCLDNYVAAGPWDQVSSNGIFPPETYLVNGGGIEGLPELASIQAARDFDGILNQNPLLAHFLCVVDSQLHGTRLLDQSCENDPNQVRISMVNWVHDFICEPPISPCNL
jgi:acetyl esterase/lipase